MTAAEWPPPEAVERAARVIADRYGEYGWHEAARAALLAAFTEDPRAEAERRGAERGWNAAISNAAASDQFAYRDSLEELERTNPHRTDAIEKGQAEYSPSRCYRPSSRCECSYCWPAGG